MEVKTFTFAPAGWRQPTFPSRQEQVIARCILAPGDTMAIRDGARARVRVGTGLVCMAEQGGFVELVLTERETCPIDRDGLTLVTARRESEVLVLTERGRAPDCIDIRRASTSGTVRVWRGPRATAALRALVRALARLRPRFL